MSRIMLAGPSGIGKTTFANIIARDYELEFQSGSMRTLMPDMKEVSHADMLKEDKMVQYQKDFQLLNLRNKKFENMENYVTDRSYLDSAAYFIFKQSNFQPQCEIDHFLDLCKMLLCKQCDKLILFDFPTYMIKDWVIEDDDKRITNKYFQHMISGIMLQVLNIWGANIREEIFKYMDQFWRAPKPYKHGFGIGKLESIYGSVDILVLHEASFEVRQEIINNFITSKLCQK